MKKSNKATINDFISLAGGPTAISNRSSITPEAVRQWGINNRLPRTEWTGETQYAELIAALAARRGEEVDPQEVRMVGYKKRVKP